jgi:hypothetical protein
MFFYIFQSGEQFLRGVHLSARLAHPREPSLPSVRDEFSLEGVGTSPYRIYRNQLQNLSSS